MIPTFSVFIQEASSRPALRLGLRPLEALLDQVERLDASRLGARIAVPDLPAELAPLAARLNELLDRLAAACDRERRFSSKLAHELRTPIAELPALAEVGETIPEKREVDEGRSLRLGMPLVKARAEPSASSGAVGLEPSGVFRVTLLLPR